jgi:uncharacterized protein
MILLDANVLIYAHREDMQHHGKYLQWLENIVNGNKVFGISDFVLSSVVRITTHPKIFKHPSSTKEILAFVEQIRKSSQCVVVNQGPKHWENFLLLVRSLKLTGNDIPDAFLAALAIEWDYELITTDQGFARFPSLRWRHPLFD